MGIKKDVGIIPLSSEKELVIASDNSGAIGMKEADEVKVSYDVVAYFNFRVAYMECVAAGGTPQVVVVHNFCADEAWNLIKRGIKRGMKELGLTLAITGSTETNFSLKQSAIGLILIGERESPFKDLPVYDREKGVAIIGRPLVGNEVLEQEDWVAPLPLFQTFACHEDIDAIVPVGSKGILYTLEAFFASQSLVFTSSIDMKKSSGPATCFIIVYRKSASKELQQLAGHLWERVEVDYN